MADPAELPSSLPEENQYRLLVAGISDYAIYMLNPQGYVSTWNPGAERFKGYVAKEIIGRHFSVFYTPEDQTTGLPDNALNIARTEGRYEAEGWRIRKDGQRFWANVVIDRILDPGGKLVGFAKITRDVSERKRAEEALIQANAALAQSQKMEAIGQLTGGIAHDFNNLLGVLSGGLDVLSIGQRPHNEQRMIESMRRAVKRGATLTQQLLAFARQQPLKPDIFDINEVISVFEPVLRRAGNSSIELGIRLDAARPRIFIDAARFEAALLNLVINARDAMPEGGRIEVATENAMLGEHEVNKLAAGEYLQISVTDTGCGIAPDTMARIFEPFFTTKELGKGTGLGLSQVYGFVAQSGGEIAVKSTPGAGACFTLYFPLHGGGEGVKTSATVLLVEDEPDVLAVTSELIRGMGLGVVPATTGHEAIEALKRNPDIALLFSDVMLPGGMNGVQLAKKVREIYPQLPVLLASGYALPVLKEVHSGVHEFPFMHKPYGMSQLAEHFAAAGLAPTRPFMAPAD